MQEIRAVFPIIRRHSIEASLHKLCPELVKWDASAAHRATGEQIHVPTQAQYRSLTPRRPELVKVWDASHTLS